MAKGYRQEAVQQKIIEVLSDSKTGMSGIEIAKKLKINRATITKYLKIFAAEGLIKQKNVGNANLWFIDSAIESFQFPQDYYVVKEKFLQYLLSGPPNKVYDLIRNCKYSGANTAKLVNEVILPAISMVQDQYLKAKISKSESKLFNNVISKSLYILSFAPVELDFKKNLVVFAEDPQSILYAEAACCVFNSLGWQTWELGDMSDAADVLFDLDIQKFLTKVWKQKQSIMVIMIFCSSEEGAKFFSESINAVKPKFGRNLHLGLFTSAKNIKAEFVSSKFDAVVQWVDSLSPPS